MLIYCITNKVTGKRYVGQTVQKLKYRYKAHWYAAENGSSRSALYSSMRKHGRDAFTSEVLEVCDSFERLQAAEQEWIERLGTLSPQGYNLRTGGNQFELTEEARENLRRGQAKRGPSRPGHGEKVRAHLKGRPRPPELVDKLRRTHQAKSHITQEIAEAVRLDYATGDHTFMTLAKKYAIGATTVSRIVTKQRH